MKRLLLAVLAAALILVSAGTVYASAYTGELSYGIEILRRKTSLLKNATSGGTVDFTAGDFAKALGFSNYTYIKITELPDVAEGILKIGGLDVIAGQTISKANIPYMKLIPSGEKTDISFKFSDASGISASEIECMVRFTNSENTAPVCYAKDFMTYKNIAVFGSLQGVDADGDELEYEIISVPKHGILTLCDTENGSFVYRPIDGFMGRDSFKYTAYDEYGNLADASTITLSVEKSYNNLCFSDMTNHWAHSNAITLIKENICALKLNEDGYPVFSPEQPVTRGEFLKMAMKTAGLDKELKEVDYTSFADDASIPYSLKKYVSYASAKGIILGVETEAGLMFCPETPITRAEAAAILNRILDVPSPESSPVFADMSDIPAWATNSMYSLVACGIINGKGGGLLDPYGELTNAQCAVLLTNTIDWMNVKKTFWQKLFGL
ncbi:MAG: S-layer homology domain-containing protein [Oscillospiraceae bacterium]|nr:S-layer homology domain-containing protein [Oscillospiraceae bacterium]